MPDEAAFWKCCEWCDARLYDGDDDEGWAETVDECDLCPAYAATAPIYDPTTEEAQG